MGRPHWPRRYQKWRNGRPRPSSPSLEEPIMPRTKMQDLPLLSELSEEQLKELFGAGPKSFRPSVEALEDRLVPAGMQYGGGAIIHHVKVEPVFYGSAWSGGTLQTQARQLH